MSDKILNYALNNYKNMFREPDGNLKYRFIVPGSIYSNSLWDWDSWFTDIALRHFVKEDISDYEQGCVLNFLNMQSEDGRIPIAIKPDSTIPKILPNVFSNIHKPCLAQHAEFIIKKNNNDAEWLRPVFHKLLKFVDYYIDNFKHESGIYFWFDDWAIGVDNDPSTFFRPQKSSGSILLNCFMYKELLAVCCIADILGVEYSKYETEATKLKTAIQKECYDEKDGMFYSVDLNLLPIDPNSYKHKNAPRHWNTLLQRIGCWSGFLAMWSGVATPEQAKRMVNENLLDTSGFWAEYGVRTLSKYEKQYSVIASSNPSCWLGPVWGISNYLVFSGLVKYGFDGVAAELAEKTVKLFEKDIEKFGEMHEYYDPETGEGITNPGFQNWNLLSIKMEDWLNKKTVFAE